MQPQNVYGIPMEFQYNSCFYMEILLYDFL